MDKILLLPIIIPLFSGIISFVIPKRLKGIREAIALIASLVNLLIVVSLFNKNLSYSLPWVGFGLDFSLRLYQFSSFIITATAAFGLLIALYSVPFIWKKEAFSQFFSYLLVTVALVNGAVLSDNLVILLFFWEGLLLTLFGMIYIGSKASFKTATKAFIIVGITDLCFLFGIALTGHIAGTLSISHINLPINNLSSIAFVFLIIGAISKSGSMPFHSWIPDAAIDAPLPFMALIPGCFEKLLGIYFLARISLDMFQLSGNSWLSVMLMSIGAITIILAVMMALIQKDYKRLLSYHAISQVGYMILGIGTALPIGIVGGLFHMINNALYKSCLFLTGGSVEKQTGTTDLEKLGGIGAKMPITFACFIITALSISGVPPFNGFFSKELVYHGALERGLIFYIAAVAGSFFTAASFLKLGHAAFLGKIKEEHKGVKEAPWAMLIPMIIIAVTCIIFGVYNYLPINKLIQPILGFRLEGNNFSGWPVNTKLVIITIVVLAAALFNHSFGAKRKGSGLKAVDHIHHAPVLSVIYDKAEKRFFDPYDWGLKFARFVSKIAWGLDKAIDWIYEVFSVKLAYGVSGQIRRLHSGNLSVYLAWVITGIILISVFLFYSV